MSKKKAQRPKKLPPAVSPPNPEPVVVATFYHEANDDVYVTCPMRVVLMWTDENYAEEFESEYGRFFEVDGETIFIIDRHFVPGQTIPTSVRKALKAAGIDVPGFSGRRK
jgi:hypothetical protein